MKELTGFRFTVFGPEFQSSGFRASGLTKDANGFQ